MEKRAQKPLALCEPFFWEDPRYIFSFQWSTKPPTELCRSELMNQVAFLLLVWILLSALCVTTGVPVLKALPIFAFVAILFYVLVIWFPAFRAPLQAAGILGARQGFEDASPLAAGPPGSTSGAQQEKEKEQKEDGEVPPVLDGFVGGTGLTGPTPSNPFMNVLVSEITGAPAKAPAASIVATDMKMHLDDFFRVQWNSDPTDVFGRAQSQREFYAVPGGTVPNDQGSYQNWLYKIPGKTCKEGGRENCLPGTDGAPMPWLNQER
jgi:hypothetical protein